MTLLGNLNLLFRTIFIKIMIAKLASKKHTAPNFVLFTLINEEMN